MVGSLINASCPRLTTARPEPTVRFLAPSRSAFSCGRWALPVFKSLREFMPLLAGDSWPSLAEVEQTLQLPQHQCTGQVLSLLAQEQVDDAEGYEPRIFRRGLIATRAGNWHDLFNAMAWKLFPRIKSALNAKQVEDIARMGPAQRSRRQCAMTQFDEAGAVVVVRDARLLDLWDRHDWNGLFLGQKDAWTDGRLQVFVIGHALFEHALHPQMLLVSKTLVLMDLPDESSLPTTPAKVDARVAQLINDGLFLLDPQELRPLPLPGIPGWSECRQDRDFIEHTPCFRPARPGRRYGSPEALEADATSPRGPGMRASLPAA